VRMDEEARARDQGHEAGQHEYGNGASIHQTKRAKATRKASVTVYYRPERDIVGRSSHASSPSSEILVKNAKSWRKWKRAAMNEVLV
jgi:hypothetical protein